jgi:hypothetical protein
MSAIEKLKAIHGKIERIFPKKTKIIYGKDEQPFTVNTKKVEPLIAPVASPEFSKAYKQVQTSCTTVKDPLNKVLQLNRIGDSPSLEGMDECKNFLYSDWLMNKDLMSKADPKDPAIPGYKEVSFTTPIIFEGECVGANRVKVCQFSEDSISIFGEESFKYPGKNREHHITSIELYSDLNNLNNLSKATFEDHDIFSDNPPLRFRVGGFQNLTGK